MDAVGTMPFTGSRTPRFHGAIFRGRGSSSAGCIRSRHEVEDDALEDVFNEVNDAQDESEETFDRPSEYHINIYSITADSEYTIIILIA